MQVRLRESHHVQQLFKWYARGETAAFGHQHEISGGDVAGRAGRKRAAADCADARVEPPHSGSAVLTVPAPAQVPPMIKLVVPYPPGGSVD